MAGWNEATASNQKEKKSSNGCVYPSDSGNSQFIQWEMFMVTHVGYKYMQFCQLKNVKKTG